MTRLLIIGPPGSGRGTQAAHIARHFGAPAVSTGDVFRTNVTRETPQGRKDDTVEAFRCRLDLYHRKTHEVMAIYAGRGLAVSVYGSSDLDAITEAAIAAVEKFLAARVLP